MIIFFLHPEKDSDGVFDLDCLGGDDDCPPDCGLGSCVLASHPSSPSHYYVYVTGFSTASGSAMLEATCEGAEVVDE